MTRLINEIKKEYNFEKEHGYAHEVKDKKRNMAQFYYERMIMFSIIINYTKLNKIAFKSKNDTHGRSLKKYFIVGINTPNYKFSYLFPIKHWNKFKCTTLQVPPDFNIYQEDQIGMLIQLLK